jgi:putative spermidine/putrescine transport system permease protein
MGRWPLRLLGLITVLFLVIPVLVVVPMSLSTSAFLEFPPPGFGWRYYEEFFGDPAWRAAIGLSLRIALGAMVVATVVGTMTAYALVRGRFRGTWLVEAVFMLPLMVPLIIFGSGAYLVELQLGMTGTTWVLVLAHAVIALPYVIMNVGAALRSTDHRLALVAQTMGASPFVAFREVTLPLIAPAISTGALLTLVLSLDETVLALFLTKDTSPTVPVAIYNTVRYSLDPSVPVAATVILGTTLLITATFLVVRRLLSATLRALARRRARSYLLETREP